MDALLTFGILWMDYQRRQLAGRAHVEGLKLFLPPGRAEIVRQRMTHLHPEAAKWQLYELDERAELCAPLDVADTGNIVTRLTHALDAETVRQRFAASVARIQALAPAAEIMSILPPRLCSGCLAWNLRGPCRPRSQDRFAMTSRSPSASARPNMCSTKAPKALFGELVRLLEQRLQRSATNLFFRLAPERWLESLITCDVRAIDERLDGRYVYSQVPRVCGLRSRHA